MKNDKKPKTNEVEHPDIKEIEHTTRHPGIEQDLDMGTDQNDLPASARTRQ